MKTILMTLLALTFAASTSMAADKKTRTPAENRCAKIEAKLLKWDQKADEEYRENDPLHGDWLKTLVAVGDEALDGCEHLKELKDKIKAKFHRGCEKAVAEQEKDIKKHTAKDFYSPYRCGRNVEQDSTPCTEQESMQHAENGLEGWIKLQRAELKIVNFVCQDTLNLNKSR